MSTTLDERVEAARKLLEKLIDATGWTRQELDEKLGLSHGYLSRLLTGNTKLTYRHILLILDAIELEPGFFFGTLHPRSRPRWESLLYQEVADELERRGHGERAAPAAPAAPPRAADEQNRRILEAVAVVLAERGPGGRPPGEPQSAPRTRKP